MAFGRRGAEKGKGKSQGLGFTGVRVMILGALLLEGQLDLCTHPYMQLQQAWKNTRKQRFPCSSQQKLLLHRQPPQKLLQDLPEMTVEMERVAGPEMLQILA